jgi:hypothetical protein
VRTLRYQVLVTEGPSFIMASIPDLRCEAFGASPADAITEVREMARGKLERYEGSTIDPPAPQRLTLTRVELPAPKTQCDRHRERRLRPVPPWTPGDS